MKKSTKILALLMALLMEICPKYILILSLSRVFLLLNMSSTI